MVSLKEFDKIVEETWKMELRKETERYRNLSKNLEKSPDFQRLFKYDKGVVLGALFFKLESNLSQNFYYHLMKKLVEKELLPEISMNVEGDLGGVYRPDILVLKKDKLWVAIEFKCSSVANEIPSLAGVEKDIIKLSELHSQYKVKRTYLFLFSKRPWRSIRKTKTHEKAIDKLKNASHLRIGYGFYEEEKWDFWNFPFDEYPDFLKNPL